MFCLTGQAIEEFKKRFRSGEITPEKLAEMDSAQRHGYFASFLGEPTAAKVNEQFEAKLLLKNQKQGIIDWAQSAAGLKPEVQRDIISRVSKMEKVLKPAEQDKFLSDLASQKVGAEVTPAEAARIFDLAKAAKEEKAKLDPKDMQSIINYGRKLLDFNEYVDSLKPKGSPFTFSNIWNLPNSALTSVLHFSAPFVQGWGMIGTKQFYQGFPKMFEYFAKEESFKDLNAYIIAHPDYKLATEAKLGITKLGDKLTLREEAIQSSLLEHVPGLGKLVKASSRAFTGYLNFVRFSRFTQLLDAARLSGEDVSKGSSVVRDIAKVVNDFTGRGAIGKNDQFAQASTVLNNVFFSPRGMSATINMFNPKRYLDPGVSPTARAAATRQMVGSLLATGAVLGLAKSMGASVNMNPTDKDFLKIKVGNTTFNPAGRNEGYVKFIARFVTNSKTNDQDVSHELGKGFGSATRADLTVSFLRAKLAPLASLIADAMWGKDLGGNKFNLVGEHGEEINHTEAYNKFVPITMQEFYNVLKNDPHNAVALVGSLAAVFGVQEEAQEPHQWSTDGKELAQFKEYVGASDFKAANQEYNSRVDERVKEIQANQEYKNLTNDEKDQVFKKEKEDIKKDIFREYNFHYRKDHQARLPKF